MARPQSACPQIYALKLFTNEIRHTRTRFRLPSHLQFLRCVERRPARLQGTVIRPRVFARSSPALCIRARFLSLVRHGFDRPRRGGDVIETGEPLMALSVICPLRSPGDLIFPMMKTCPILVGQRRRSSILFSFHSIL